MTVRNASFQKDKNKPEDLNSPETNTDFTETIFFPPDKDPRFFRLQKNIPEGKRKTGARSIYSGPVPVSL